MDSTVHKQTPKSHLLHPKWTAHYKAESAAHAGAQLSQIPTHRCPGYARRRTRNAQPKVTSAHSSCHHCAEGNEHSITCCTQNKCAKQVGFQLKIGFRDETTTDPDGKYPREKCWVSPSCYPCPSPHNLVKISNRGNLWGLLCLLLACNWTPMLDASHTK